MKIFLFCNDGFGRAFQDIAVAFARLNHVDLTIVHSGDRRKPAAALPTSRRMRFLARRKLDQIAFRARHGVRLAVVDDVNDERFGRMVAWDDVGIVAGFNQIFKQHTIDRFHSLVNFHPSVLPRYRGPVPSYWCIRHREPRSGYTLHRVVATIDAGPILYQGTVPIAPDDTPESLNDRIAQCAGDTLRSYLAHIVFGETFVERRLDAGEIYQQDVGYLSFPRG